MHTNQDNTATFATQDRHDASQTADCSRKTSTRKDRQERRLTLMMGGACVTVAERLIAGNCLDFDCSKEIDNALYSQLSANEQIETAETCDS